MKRIHYASKRAARRYSRQSEIAPDLRKLEQQLARLDQLIDILRAGDLAEQREAIDALLESAEQKNGTLTKVTFRQWARGLVQDPREDTSSASDGCDGILRMATKRDDQVFSERQRGETQ